ncbi:MAG TPA: DHA2 family efflux MFS transporter permease subunit [Polyangiaceae bacterium]|nr:DHA2 family efflux MFS transporter permease subunit [Polyangiaceae bacterium]
MGGVITGSKAGITFVVMCAALLALVDVTIVNVALNDIRASFGTPLDQIGWVSTGYMMANVVVIPLTGWFQRRFGFRRYFAGSILLFTAASALCGLAWSLPALVAFRVLQGLGGGAIIPTAQTILFARYPKEQHGTAGALFGLGAVTGPLLGPTVGGYLIDWASWQWCFLVNVPLGALAALLALRFLEEPGFRPARAPIDTFGIALLAIGMASLQYVLEEGNRESWFESPVIAALAGVAAATLVAFVVHELETEHPVVDLRVFASRAYAAGTGINLLMGVALFSGNFLFALYCGSVLRYAALDIGRVFLVSGAAQVVMMPVIGRLTGKVDPRALLALGVVGVAASLWMNSHLTEHAGYWDLVRSMTVRAIALGFVFIPITVLALSDLPPARRGNAAGLFNLTRALGGSVGTAWMGLVVDRGLKTHGAHLAEHLSPFEPATQEQYRALQGLFGGRPLLPEALLAQRLRTQALVLSFQEGFRLATAAFFIALVLVFLLRRPGPAAGPAGGPR